MNKGLSLVSFHNHDVGSPSDAIIQTRDYIEQAAMLNAQSIAISNHGNLSTWIDFQEHCKKKGIKPIAAVEFYGALSSDPKSKKSYHVLVIAKTEIGYRNLLKLVHLSNTVGFYMKPRITEKMIFENKEGLAVGNACISGFVTQHLMKGDETSARVIAQEFKQELGHNYFFEIMPHANPLQASLNKQLMKIAKELDINVGVTLDVHFKDPSYEEVYLINGRNRRGITKSVIDENPPEDCLLQADFHFKSCDCIVDTLIDHGLERRDILAAMDYTVQLDKEIDFEFKDKFDLPIISEDPDKDLEKLLAEKIVEMFGGKYFIPQEYKERLRSEFEIIKEKKFSGYFLILYDLVNFAKNNGITIGPGRGSAGGSLIAYVLNITEIDPVLYNLPHDRFQNRYRSSMLDIDTDVSPGDRGKLIEYLKQKYGKDNVVQMVTFGEVKAKAAIKEIAKYMEIPFAEVNAVCSTIPSLHYDDEGALVDVELKEALEIPEVQVYQRKYPDLFKLALQLEHSYKSFGCHAGAVIVTPKPIYEIAPTALKKGDEEIMMVGWDKKGCEKIGLVKLDALGLSTLDVLAECEKLTGIKLSDIPLDDEKTWEFLSDAKFMNGIFQLVENQTKRYLREVKPKNIIDLAILNSALRPGSDYKTFITNRNNDVIKPEVDLPVVRETLKETAGALVFQDDLMFLISNLSELNLGEADLMRRALEKNDKEKVDEFKERFSKTCKYPEQVEEIFEWLQSKVGYAFCKAHAVAYSIVGFRCAYMKCHYPHEFLIANIKNPKSNNKFTESEYINEFIQEARQMGIEVKLPNAKKCQIGPFYDPEEKCVYLGLSSLKGITNKPADVIIDAAKLHGDDVKEFCDYCFDHKVDTGNLSKAGKPILRSVITKAHLRTLLNIGFIEGDLAKILDTYNKLYKEKLEIKDDLTEAANEALGFDFYSPYAQKLSKLPAHFADKTKYKVVKVVDMKSGEGRGGYKWNLLKMQSEEGQLSAFVKSFGTLKKDEWIVIDWEPSKKGGDSITINHWEYV